MLLSRTVRFGDGDADPKARESAKLLQCRFS